MSRTGELSALQGYHNRFTIDLNRSGRILHRGENRISLLDGRLEDSITSGRYNRSDNQDEVNHIATKGVGSVRQLY